MKKIVLAIAAVFAMSTAVFAQDAFEGVNENEGLNSLKSQIALQMMQKADLTVNLEIGDLDLSELQDVTMVTENGAINTVNLNAAGGNRIAASLLAIFLGDFGIHHFYTGDTKHGIWHLVFCWTVVPGIIGLIEGIMWLLDEGSYPDPLFNI